jgi:hypothetical protein
MTMRVFEDLRLLPGAYVQANGASDLHTLQEPFEIVLLLVLALVPQFIEAIKEALLAALAHLAINVDHILLLPALRLERFRV